MKQISTWRVDFVCVNPIPCVGSGSYPIARHPSHSQWSVGNGTWRPPPCRNDRTKTLTCAATSQKCMVLVFFFGGGVRFISISTNVGQCFFSGGWWIIISLSRCFNWILIVWGCCIIFFQMFYLAFHVRATSEVCIVGYWTLVLVAFRGLLASRQVMCICQAVSQQHKMKRWWLPLGNRKCWMYWMC